MPPIEEQLRVAQLLAPDLAEMIDARKGGDVRAALSELDDPEVADLLMELSPQQRVLAFRFLTKSHQSDVFAYLPPEQQETLLSELSNVELSAVLGEMAPDDRVELLAELPGAVASRLLALLKPEERRQTQYLLGYPEQSVGRLMTPDYLTARPEWTVRQTLDHLRRHGRDAETFSMVYVVDERGRLLDDLRIRQLLLAEPELSVRSLMDEQAVSLRATADREEAVRAMERYDRPALPVVSEEGVLVGIVTFDDVADVAQQEATEDMHKMAALRATDEPYRSASLAGLVRQRLPWLLLLFVGGTLTASAMARFGDALDRAAVLALFVPLIIASGGNSGSQASTLIIRSMALGELALSDWWRVLLRELTVGLVLGLCLGAIGLLRVSLWHHLGLSDYTAFADRVALVVAASLVGVVIWGTLMGAMLPFLLRRCRLDPATISAPFVATLVDVTGLIIYFTTALVVLRGTLL